DIIIHVTCPTGEDLRNRHALILGLVREHRTGDDVPDRVDALQAGDKMRVDLHAAAIVERNARLLQTEPFRIRDAADRNQHDIGLKLFRGPARRRLDLRYEGFARSVDSRDLGPELERKALLLKDALKLLGDLAVHSGQDAIKEFHDRHLRTEPVPDRAELKPDHAGADDQQLSRYLLERERAGRRYDSLLVDLDALQLRDIRAGGKDNVLRLDDLRLAVGGGNLELSGAENLRPARDDVDLVLLHQEFDALDVAVDTLLLEIHHRRQIELRRRHAYTHLRKGMGGFLEHFGGVQERFRRHAPDIEARAAEGRILFDHGNLHAELGRADRADIPARTGADNNDVVSHERSPVGMMRFSVRLTRQEPR